MREAGHQLKRAELTADVTEDNEIVLEPSYVGYLRQNGYSIRSVEEAHSVPSGASDGAYIVMKIWTYEYPTHDDRLDLVADKCSLWTCSCKGFTYQKSADVSESPVKPTESGVCKHIEAVKRKKASNHPDQTELVS